MSGLEKIVDRISGESADKIKAILSEAEEKAAGIKSENEKRIADECGRISKKAESEAATIAERGKASAELKTKQLLLAGKQEILKETIDMARDRLSGLSDGEYIDVFVQLFKKHVPTQDAVLRLGAKDLGRIPSEVLDSLKSMASEAGAKLTVSGEAAPIKDGFVLDYGGVEENCTFDALIDQNMDDLLDKVKSILFA